MLALEHGTRSSGRLRGSSAVETPPASGLLIVAWTSEGRRERLVGAVGAATLVVRERRRAGALGVLGLGLVCWRMWRWRGGDVAGRRSAWRDEGSGCRDLGGFDG